MAQQEELFAYLSSNLAGLDFLNVSITCGWTLLMDLVAPKDSLQFFFTHVMMEQFKYSEKKVILIKIMAYRDSTYSPGLSTNNSAF